MLFDENKQQRRLKHILTKYAKVAKSDPQQLLSCLPKEEFWRYFIDGRLQQSTRHLREAFVDKHGEVLLQDERFLSLTMKEYVEKYNRINDYFPNFPNWHDELPHLDRFLAKKLFLSQKQYQMFLANNLNAGNATIRDVLLLDQGWLAFDIDEPHYLASVIKAFFTMMQSNEELSVDLIKKTHALLGEKIRGTNYDNIDIKPGEFRNSPLYAYGMVDLNASLRGITEMLARKNKSHAFIFTIAGNRSYRRYRAPIDRDSLDQFHKHKDISVIVAVDENGNPYSDIDPDDCRFDRAIVELYTWICATKSTDELAALLYNLITNNYPLAKLSSESEFRRLECEVRYAHLVPSNNIQQFYETMLQELIDCYLVVIESVYTPYDQLRVIITFVQQCEQLHPFYDMNCRLFCMVMLNYLLAQNGFPFAIQIDPNRFDLYAIDELIEDIITGMKLTFDLIEKKPIHGVDTEQVLNALKISPTHQSTFYAEFTATINMITELSNAPPQHKAPHPNYRN